MTVSAQDAENEEHGVAVPVPDGWHERPEMYETLCMGATMTFLQYVAKNGIVLPIGSTLYFQLKEIA